MCLGRRSWLSICPPLRSGFWEKTWATGLWAGGLCPTALPGGRPTPRYFHASHAKFCICKHNVFLFSCWVWSFTVQHFLHQPECEQRAETVASEESLPLNITQTWSCPQPPGANQGWAVTSFCPKTSSAAGSTCLVLTSWEDHTFQGTVVSQILGMIKNKKKTT